MRIVCFISGFIINEGHLCCYPELSRTLFINAATKTSKCHSGPDQQSSKINSIILSQELWSIHLQNKGVSERILHKVARCCTHAFLLHTFTVWSSTSHLKFLNSVKVSSILLKFLYTREFCFYYAMNEWPYIGYNKLEIKYFISP